MPMGSSFAMRQSIKSPPASKIGQMDGRRISPQTQRSQAFLVTDLEDSMKLSGLVLAIPFLIATLAIAEDRLPPKVVRVVGTSEVKVIPDRAVIEIGVEKQNPSAGVAKQMADAAARRLLASLRSSGV